ncbi:MAG: hypothetical protein WCJ68_06565 [Chitinophagia bacterium]|jgi:hypothetical protein
MEPKLLQFLNRIMRTIGLGVLWMTLNSTIGIMWGYAYVQATWHLSNILFYSFLVLSFTGLLYVLYRLWCHPIGIEVD